MKTSKRTDSAARDSRRRFAKTVAAAVVAAPIASASGQRPTATPPAEPKAPPNPSTTPAQQRPSPVAEGYADVARARFGGKFTDEEFERIKRDIRGNVSAAEALRAYKLENWDEPDTVFNA